MGTVASNLGYFKSPLESGDVRSYTLFPRLSRLSVRFCMYSSDDAPVTSIDVACCGVRRI